MTCSCGKPALETGFGTLCWECFSKAEDAHTEREKQRQRGQSGPKENNERKSIGTMGE
jgi:hypothetical protein